MMHRTKPPTAEQGKRPATNGDGELKYPRSAKSPLKEAPVADKTHSRDHTVTSVDSIADATSLGQLERQQAQIIFNKLADVQGAGHSDGVYLSGRRFLDILRANGLLRTDPRLAGVVNVLDEHGGVGARLSFHDFNSVIAPCKKLVINALDGGLVVGDFEGFARKIRAIYDDIKANVRGGKNADYIPQLGKVNPEFFAVSICTIDGQQLHLGDFRERFCIQSCSKPITYALGVEEWGVERVHHHVGIEPSGHSFNELELMDRPPKPPQFNPRGDRIPHGIAVASPARTPSRAPSITPPRARVPLNDEEEDDGKAAKIAHNACINAGAITCCSLVQPSLALSERVEYVVNAWERLCGSEVSIDSSVFLSERDTADRNFALAYLLRESGALAKGADNIAEILEFYFQLCSIQMTSQQLAVVAASLANGGLNPLTSDRVFSPLTVQCALSQMAVAGMYDYSGMWAFKVGVPSKSGVGGAIYAPIPGLGGVVAWSPPLDSFGNSVRAVAFFERLARECTLHYFSHLNGMEEISHRTELVKPRTALTPTQQLRLLFAAGRGDMRMLKRLMAAGVDINIRDHDRRTALHIAACEGQMRAVRFLVEHGSDVSPRDRWNHTPLSDAIAAGHDAVARYIRTAGGVPNHHGAWRRLKLFWIVSWRLTRPRRR